MIGSIEIVVKSIIDAELLDIDLAPVENIVNPVFSIDIGVAVVGCSGSGTPVSSLVTVFPMFLVLGRSIILRTGVHIPHEEGRETFRIVSLLLICINIGIGGIRFLVQAGVRIHEEEPDTSLLMGEDGAMASPAEVSGIARIIDRTGLRSVRSPEIMLV